MAQTHEPHCAMDHQLLNRTAPDARLVLTTTTMQSTWYHAVQALVRSMRHTRRRPTTTRRIHTNEQPRRAIRSLPFHSFIGRTIYFFPRSILQSTTTPYLVPMTKMTSLASVRMIDGIPALHCEGTKSSRPSHFCVCHHHQTVGSLILSFIPLCASLFLESHSRNDAALMPLVPI